MIYLVRHAKARSRSNWTADDRIRPLTASGRAQAEGIAGRLAEHASGRLVSSPYLRCVQTLEPLAAALGTTVEADDRLGEGAALDDTLALISELPEGSVLCSHGDVIPETIAGLARRGCHLEGQPDWRKAATWVLQRVEGNVERAWAVAPPAS